MISIYAKNSSSMVLLNLNCYWYGSITSQHWKDDISYQSKIFLLLFYDYYISMNIIKFKLASNPYLLDLLRMIWQMWWWSWYDISKKWIYTWHPEWCSLQSWSVQIFTIFRCFIWSLFVVRDWVLSMWRCGWGECCQTNQP